MIRQPPKLLRPQTDTTLFVTPTEDDEDLVEARAEVIVDGALFRQELPSAFTSSSYWNGFVANFRSCEQTIKTPDIVITGFSERSIDLRLDVVVERHLCGPFNSGARVAGAHVVGPIRFFQAQVTDPEDGQVYHDFRGLEAGAGPFSVVASNEQNFFFSILQATPLGVQLAAGGVHYDNLKNAASSLINAHVAGQRYDVTKDFYAMLGSAITDAQMRGAVYQQGVQGPLPPMQLRDVQFVTGPSGGLSFKLSYEYLLPMRRGEACSALRRMFGF